ncbi:energy transducer TonB [Photobacterium sp. TY1-4]|uniref:energy transducer TonB n=1 Tax=Photobacterium sp. TY1-4 TaxID=2899122 RepID=UPI0021BE18FE|nr:energy transducer TonB [Photobacterium sp. TY1-4]UXI02512.1 energy transducer TonB [Photobacterium sp. TY1-4]
MNSTRYVIAGAVSILVHGVLLSAVPNNVAMAMPAGTHSARVSVNLVATPPPVQQARSAQPEPQVQQPEPKPVSTPTQTKAAPVPAKTTPQPDTSRVKKLVKKAEPAADKHVERTPMAQAKQPQPVIKKPKPVQQPIPKVLETPVAPPKDRPVTTNAETPSKPSSEQPQQAAQAAAGVNSVPKMVSKPTFATRPSPLTYPSLAKRRGIEGVVKVEVWIDPNGKQIKQLLVKSSGTEILDQAALEAIKRWHFSSHIVDGQAIAHRVQIPVRFQLD